MEFGMSQTQLRQVQGDAMKFLQEPDLGTSFALCFSARRRTVRTWPGASQPHELHSLAVTCSSTYAKRIASCDRLPCKLVLVFGRCGKE